MFVMADVSSDLHDELTKAALANGISVAQEINQRLELLREILAKGFSQYQNNPLRFSPQQYQKTMRVDNEQGLVHYNPVPDATAAASGSFKTIELRFDNRSEADVICDLLAQLRKKEGV